MSFAPSNSTLVVVAAAAAAACPSDEPILRNRHSSTKKLLSLRDFETFFRLRSDEFHAIHAALDLPHQIITDARDSLDSQSALLVLLGFLGGARLSSLGRTFRRSESACSRIVKSVSRLIVRKWGGLLDITSAHQGVLTPSRIRTYAQAIARQHCPVRSLWGFLDGTVRPIARPSRRQRDQYNGHKRVHGIKYQVVIAADGMLWVDGPYQGRRNDAFLLAESGLHEWLDEHSHGPDGQDLFIFGDKAYAPRGHLLVPHKGLALTAREKEFNFRMSQHRIAVEWAIGSVPTMFPRFETKRLQRSLQADLDTLYRCAVLLRNALSCIIGNTTSQTFRCNPPMLDDYFASECSATPST